MFDMAEAGAAQNLLTRTMGGWFVDVDVLVTPTVCGPAWPLGELNADNPALDAQGWLAKVFSYAPTTALFNVTGQPAFSLPLAVSGAGLPIGVQLVARAGAEDLLFRVAAQLEAALPWADRRPAVRAG
jgi:amidase